jgi:putative FmdB family regulatory protein
MPTYEYACAKCGRTFEKVQSILDKPLTVCPKDVCGQKKWGRGKVKRVISAGAGLLFKGNGFYITDYRSEGYKKSAQSESAAPAAPATPAPSSTAAASPSKSETSASATKPAKTKTSTS